MKRKNLIIYAIISFLLIIIVAIVLLIIAPKIKKAEIANNISEQPSTLQEETSKNTTKEPIIAILDKKENDDTNEEQIQIKDAAMITQELQEMDINIGKLEIPKTGISTEVYCKQDANKMEDVPCMLYTNQGPNQPGITILVGHNRANGTLFSDNEKLEENDEFYFKDYIQGTEKKYIVTSKFITSGEDVSFYNTQSDSPLIAMQCCLTPTDTHNVLIIMAKGE